MFYFRNCILIILFNVDLLSSKILLEFQPFKQENVQGDKNLLAVVLVRKNEVDTKSSEDDSDTGGSNENALRNTKLNTEDEDSKETDSSRERTLDNKIQSRKGYFNETNVNLRTPIILRSSCNKAKCERKCNKACRRAYKSICNKYSCTSEVKQSFKYKCEDVCNEEFSDDDYY